ncbi:hypothetical protein L3X38_007891 [Prunus dulcis]|uniref:Uncharacterized protein n=1 Tax=Prunus dulcis TaxID=3755 RepID=A0AAD4ZVU3_PRUDU|nr:hypothetical protein L3X38_007891 [Prunus dulcis]
MNPKPVSSQKASRYEDARTLMHIEGTDGNKENLCASKVEHFVDFCRNLYLPLPLKPPAKGRLETLKHTQHRRVTQSRSQV